MKIIKSLSLYLLLIATLIQACQSKAQNKKTKKEPKDSKMKFKVIKTEAEWKKDLSPAQFHVLREKGTEQPGTGTYNLHFKKGTYSCAACGTPLFESNNKYESHCGWPSFDDAIDGAIIYKDDNSLGMLRTEIVCANCGGHLGHIFDDGPQETTGKRYCVNSLSLEFEENRK